MNGRHDVFVKDMVSGRLELVSKSMSGTTANGTSGYASISADGRFVTFSSDATDLVEGDTNGAKDVFIVDLAETGFWQGIEKVGSNVRVNSTTAGNQTGSGIVALDDGRFLVAMFDAPNGKLKGQWFDAAGDKSGSEFEIGPGSGGGYVSSLKLANGSFLVFTEREFVLFDSAGVAIESAVPQLTGHSGYIHLAPTQTGFVIAASVNGYTQIGIQAYDFAGQKVGPQFTVASGTFNEFVTKDVVGFGNGGFGLLFDQVSTGLLLQRFDSAGNAVGTPERISSSTSDINFHSQIDSVALADGRAFVAWSQDGMIRGRFLAADGTPQGTEFAVSPATPSGQLSPHVLATSAGNISVVWTSGTTIYAQLLSATGEPLADSVVVSTSASPHWTVNQIALPNGGIFINWRGADGSGEGAEARVLDAQGQIVSDEIIINDVTSGNQYGDQAAVNSAGIVLSTFVADDGNGFGVFAQKLQIGGASTVPTNTAPTDISIATPIVAENAPAGTVVGTLSATDANAGDTHTFALTSDPSGFFEIVGNEVRVKSGAAIDYEALSGTISATATVVGTLGGGSAATILDGVVPAERENWQSRTAWWTGFDTKLVIDLGGPIALSDYEISVDNNDTYLIEVSTDGQTFTTLSTIDRSYGHNQGGMESYSTLAGTSGYRSEMDFAPVTAAFVRISAIGPDYLYSVGEFRAFGVDQPRIPLTISTTDQTGLSYSETIWISVGNVSGFVTGTAAGETLTGTSEEDVVSGLGGNDTLIGGAGEDLLDGGAGTDTADYALAAAGLTVSLAHVDRNTGDAAGDTYVSIERLVGSYHADVLYGNRWTSTEIDGGAGDDRLFGYGDSDMLSGNLGTDRLYGGDGGDILIGGQDYDVLYGEGGDDLLDGVDGETVKVADHLVGGLGDDHYIVDGDTVIEAAGQGFDTVETRSRLSGLFSSLSVTTQALAGRMAPVAATAAVRRDLGLCEGASDWLARGGRRSATA